MSQTTAPLGSVANCAIGLHLRKLRLSSHELRRKGDISAVEEINALLLRRDQHCNAAEFRTEALIPQFASHDGYSALLRISLLAFQPVQVSAQNSTKYL